MSFKKTGYLNFQVVVCALIEEDGKVLFVRQAPHERFAGKWDFPGGHVKKGETLQQTLQREILEELAIKVKFERISGYAEYIKAPHHVLIFICRSKIIEGKLKTSNEIDKIEWVSPKDFKKYDKKPLTNLEIFQDFRILAHRKEAPDKVC